MIFIALGANLPSRHGSPLETLIAARNAMGRKGVSVQASSRVWLTAPVPVSDQPFYHNAVIQVETNMDPRALLSCLAGIENDFGRVRVKRNEARVLDLDLISYRDCLIGVDDLIIPHPRLHQRAFVLMPLRDIAPSWVHPGLQKSVPTMIADLPEQDAHPLQHAEGWS